MASETVILMALVIASLVERTLPCINTLGLPPLDLKLQSRATQNVIGRSALVLKKMGDTSLGWETLQQFDITLASYWTLICLVVQGQHQFERSQTCVVSHMWCQLLKVIHATRARYQSAMNRGQIRIHTQVFHYRLFEKDWYRGVMCACVCLFLAKTG